MRTNETLWKMVKENLRARHFIESMKLKKEKEEESESKSFSDKTCKEKIMTIIDFPFIWVRKLSIPPCDADEYEENWWLVIIWPFFGIPTIGMLAMK